MDIKTMQSEILRLKEETNTLILAHLYQTPDIIEIADVAGDSYALSVAAAEYDHERVIVCGVRFMAETVKILSPFKRVRLPQPLAGCPMAEQIHPERVAEFKRQHPDTAVVTYINTTAKLKAECDVCVTSSSAVKIIKALPQKDILFIPDKHLGAYVQKHIPEKNFTFWDGFCPIHTTITKEDVDIAREMYPDALLATHPEAQMDVLKASDFVGATTEIIKFAESTNQAVIFGTEMGIYHHMSIKHPEREFYQLAPHKLICPDMKITTLGDVYRTLKGAMGEEIILEKHILGGAKRALNAMVNYAR